MMRGPAVLPQMRWAEHDRVFRAIYRDCAKPFCEARSRLVQVIMRERAIGLLPNDTFEQLVAAAANPGTRQAVFNFFQISPPVDIACA